MTKDPDALIESFRRAGQGQVFAHVDGLPADARSRLLDEAAEIDLGEVDRLVRSLVTVAGTPGVDLEGLAPAPYERLPARGGNAPNWAKAKAVGETALRAGRVAAFTVAGGQGTRLGYDGPKGTFPVTPVRNHSLFQVFAEKILAAGRRYVRALHWFIMTSHQNHDATEAYFRENRHFGLDPLRVHFFRQGRMPAVDFSGKIMLETQGSLALSPDGHGGSLRALERSGALDLMSSEGIDTLSFFQVDNPLVRCIDPAFIGWHLLAGSEMSSKTVPKAYPEEKLGHFCIRKGKLCVIEYSDLPMALQRETDPATGALRYEAGSIAIHAIDREFIRRMASGDGALPFHRADKKITTVDAAGSEVKPSKANGVKFEMFVFDALPSARNPVVIETGRVDDFSPVKNAEGVDSPATCRSDQIGQFARWLRMAGATVPADPSGKVCLALEVSPLFGYDEDSFMESWSRLETKPEVAEGLCLEKPSK
jgi:UDP-N-acetylglucosamine/UDP-N-acetylgalactosamine diphosphorylase